MAAPVRATPGQVVDADRKAAAQENLGSYPEEITADQLAWLKERAAARRQKWAEHARSVASNQKS
jgi:hypothetical protein